MLRGERLSGYLPWRSAWILLLAALTASGCGDSLPTQPAPVVSTPPPPTVVPNAPPAITSLTLSSPRVEAGEDVQLTAAVEDTDTPVDQLIYEWSAAPPGGQFSGSGRQVRWTAPVSLTTPDLYTLTLKVKENYTSNGQMKTNSTTSAVQVHYNDSRRDISRISLRFLTELFPDHSIPAAVAVQDFSDNLQLCPTGKADEFRDVTNNRVNFQILSGTYTALSIDLNGDRTTAEVRGTCVFRDIPLDPGNSNYGKREDVSGTCHLTSVYDNWQWHLCKSSFEPPYGVALESLRFRVPGPIIQR